VSQGVRRPAGDVGRQGRRLLGKRFSTLLRSFGPLNFNQDPSSGEELPALGASVLRDEVQPNKRHWRSPSPHQCRRGGTHRTCGRGGPTCFPLSKEIGPSRRSNKCWTGGPSWTTVQSRLDPSTCATGARARLEDFQLPPQFIAEVSSHPSSGAPSATALLMSVAGAPGTSPSLRQKRFPPAGNPISFPADRHLARQGRDSAFAPRLRVCTSRSGTEDRSAAIARAPDLNFT
jgi:hypothetical protein